MIFVILDMGTFWKDIKHGFRMLRKNPGFTAVAALSLALGIGVNTTLFSLVNAILLRPMPVADPDRLVEIYSASAEFEHSVSSYLDYVDLRDGNDVFSSLAAHSMINATLVHQGRPELILGEVVTWNYFEVLGVEPTLGRSFLPEEDIAPGRHPVAILGHGFWQSRFGGDPSILGQTVRLGAIQYTVVGVVPETFTGTVPGFCPDVWVPMMMADEVEPNGMTDVTGTPETDSELEERGRRWLFLKGRLKPNATVDQARSQLAAIMTRLEEEYPDTNEKRSINVLPASHVRFHPMIDSALSPAAALMLAIVGLVLLIACANVANMLLARASARKQEIAVRLALGAGRARLVRQLMTEGFLLAGSGGALGLLFAHWAADLFLTFSPPSSVPITLDLGLDSRVFLFALSASLIAGLAFGMAPALQLSRPDLVPSLKNEAVRLANGERRFSLRNLLVIGQIAVSLVLLIGAALLIRSLGTARSLDVGFDVDRLAVMAIDLELQGYSEEEGIVFLRQLMERIRALPSVSSAALAQRLPLTVNLSMAGIYIGGHQQSPDDSPFVVDQTRVGPDYLRTMGIPLIEGRDFTAADTRGAAGVVVVTEAMAGRFWPGESPIGKRFHTERLDGPAFEVIGVAGDHKIRTVGEEPRPFIHFVLPENLTSYTRLVVRTTGEPAIAVQNLRQEMLAMDSDLILLEADTMRAMTEVTLLPVRMGAALVGAFGVLGMLLAAVGLYGVIAYSVSRRTHEIGLRMALGANAGDVLKLVIRQGMIIALVGVALGLAGAAVVSRVLSSILYVSAIDPASFGAAAILLLSVGFLANYVPARRASRVEPLVALRYE